MFGHLRSFKGWIQTEACVIPSYHGMLNRESVSEPQTLSGRLFQSLGARYEKVLPPLVDFAILGTTKSPEFCDLREQVGL